MEKYFGKKQAKNLSNAPGKIQVRRSVLLELAVSYLSLTNRPKTGENRLAWLCPEVKFCLSAPLKLTN